MKFILVPFKNFNLAKSRMRKDLSAPKTEKIVEKMLSHVLSEVSKSKLSDSNYIVTNDLKAIEIARQLGIKVIKEDSQIDESSSVDSASEMLIKKGAKSLLRIPGDLPLVKHEDIDEIFSISTANNTSVIVPSKSGKGTNAILRNPPNAIQSFFGQNSLQKHIEEFERKKIKFKIIKMKNVELDLDCLKDFEDLQEPEKKEYLEIIN